MGKSEISWTDAAWSPVRGCTPASAGCANCWAVRTVWRLAHSPHRHLAAACAPLVDWDAASPKWTGHVRLAHESLAEPLHWRKPRRIFVAPQGDLFHPAVPYAFLDRVWATMLICSRHDTWAPHTFQVLTKRADRMRDYLTDPATLGRVAVAAGGRMEDGDGWHDAIAFDKRGLADEHIWLGVTAENRAAADERIPHLLETPAAVRWVSVEPMIGAVDITTWLEWPECTCESGPDAVPWHGVGCPRNGRLGNVDWVVVGGESGPGARPCDVAWVRSIVEQCKAAGTACFVKQLGAKSRGWCAGNLHGDPGEEVECDIYEASEGPVCCGRCHFITDRSGADPDEWPEDLRVREYPEVTP